MKELNTEPIKSDILALQSQMMSRHISYRLRLAERDYSVIQAEITKLNQEMSKLGEEIGLNYLRRLKGKHD